MKRLINRRIITAVYVKSPVCRPKIRLSEERYGVEEVCYLDYCPETRNVLDQVISYLENSGNSVLGFSQTGTEYNFFVDEAMSCDYHPRFRFGEALKS